MQNKSVITNYVSKSAPRNVQQLTNPWLPFFPQVDLGLGDGVPDAGQPVRHQGEGEHEQRQDERRVLVVAVHLLQEARQPKQSRQL